jgi:hypothetical protein
MSFSRLILCKMYTFYCVFIVGIYFFSCTYILTDFYTAGKRFIKKKLNEQPNKRIIFFSERSEHCNVIQQ